MKLVGDVAKKLFMADEPERLVHFRLFEKRIIALNPAMLNTQMQCFRCNGTRGLSPILWPDKGPERVWFCIDAKCMKQDEVKSKYSEERETQVDRDYWTKWRNENDVGDIWADMSGKIYQAEGMRNELAKYARRPSKVLILAGNPGTGKTYCAFKIAHFYLQFRGDCLFFTASSLRDKWMQAMHDGSMTHFMHRLREYGLLIIDDFGQQDVTPGFMGMLFELISYRMQWHDRGTILTTNQSAEALMLSVGQAMADRLRGQTWLRFNGLSQR